MKSYLIFSTFLLSALLTSASVRAGLIVESADSAMQRNMFVVQDLADHKQTVKVTSHPKISYKKAIAKKLFNAENGAVVLADLNASKTSVKLYKGQFLAVRILEEDGSMWNFENISPELQFVKKEKRNGVLILLYHAIDAGAPRLNFDLMSGNKALLSKILNVRII